MKTILRVIVLFGMLVGIVVLARNQVAWAANFSGVNEQDVLRENQHSALDQNHDDCDKPENKDKPRCKDKDKCKKKPCGTVKPPPKKILIPVTGEYSVGGLCTLSVSIIDPNVVLDASVKSLAPSQLPEDLQNVRDACLLQYSRVNGSIDELTPDLGTTTICFAGVPGEDVTVYFFNLQVPDSTWMPLETTLEGGRACAAASHSGFYVATFSLH